MKISEKAGFLLTRQFSEKYNKTNRRFTKKRPRKATKAMAVSLGNRLFSWLFILLETGADAGPKHSGGRRAARRNMTLEQFFDNNRKLALAFSGGTDSAFLLAQGLRQGCDLRPYFVKTVFQPRFELEDAQRLCAQFGVQLAVIELDVLANGSVAANPTDRCYFCKTAIFTALIARAAQDGYSTVIDGTNASDDTADRPGMRALLELGVVSPLRICGITKQEVRQRSAQLGLFTANKPSYACLATRVPAGTAIEAGMLTRVERGEEALRGLGFSDLRLRLLGERGGKLQLPEEQLVRAARMAQEIRAALSRDFDSILLDLQPR